MSSIDDNKGQKLPTNFKATPVQVLEALPNSRLCPSKKSFLTGIADFFSKLEKSINKPFEYKLTGENEIPVEFSSIEIDGKTLKQKNEILNGGGFSCEKSDCECGKGKTLREVMKELLDLLGVEESEIIKLTPKN